MTNNRIARPDIEALVTANRRVVLGENQSFYSTPKSFEVWDNEPLRMVCRISRKRVLWEFGKSPEI